MSQLKRPCLWYTVLLITIGLLLVTSLPYIYAAHSTPEDMIYTGLMYDVPDHAQYWSWVTASRDGLFISNTMTPEPNPPIFMNPMMWVLARIQVVFGLSFPVLFQCWRVAATVLLVGALCAFLNSVIKESAPRRTAAIIAVFGSGLGWILVIAKKLLGAGDVPFPIDLYTVEPNTFWGLLAYPYLPLGQAFILLTITGAWLVRRGDRRWAFVLTGLSSFILALTHAYDLIVVYTVLAAFGLCCWVRTRTFPTELLLVGIVVGMCSGPVALYYRALTAHDPLWRSILAQYANAGVWTPRHIHLVILMGVPMILAVIALLRPRWDDESFLLVGVWGIVGTVLIYIPAVYQIKLLAGWQFPMAVLAAYGWHDRFVPLLDRLSERLSLPRLGFGVNLATATLIVLIVPTNVYLYAWRLVELRRHQSPYYLHHDEAAALDWLSKQGKYRETVLAPPAIGQFVPNYGQSRAYLAHWAMTNRFYERSANVARFFSSETTDSWRGQMMARERVTIVLRSGTPSELAAMYDPAGSSLFEQALDLPRAQIFRVRPVDTSGVSDPLRQKTPVAIRPEPPSAATEMRP